VSGICANLRAIGAEPDCCSEKEAWNRRPIYVVRVLPEKRLPCWRFLDSGASGIANSSPFIMPAN